MKKDCAADLSEVYLLLCGAIYVQENDGEGIRGLLRAHGGEKMSSVFSLLCDAVYAAEWKLKDVLLTDEVHNDEVC